MGTYLAAVVLKLAKIPSLSLSSLLQPPQSSWFFAWPFVSFASLSPVSSLSFTLLSCRVCPARPVLYSLRPPPILSSNGNNEAIVTTIESEIL